MRVRPASMTLFSVALTRLLACNSGFGSDAGDSQYEEPPPAIDRVAPDAGDVPPAPDTGVDVAPRDAATLFPPGTICNATGSSVPVPAHLETVIIVMMSDESFNSVIDSAQAPYFNTLAAQCALSSGFVDNVIPDELSGEAHYLALTSGSNCDTGIDDPAVTTGATGCITDDGEPATHTLSTPSIFSSGASWRVYVEGMPSICDPTDTATYLTRHNPPVFYTAAAASCNTSDVPLTPIVCSTAPNVPCSPPDNLFTETLVEDELPHFVMLIPSPANDMYSGTIAQADNWLSTYLPLVFASPAYLRGGVAVYVLWDEAGTPGGAMPNLFISPYVVRMESMQPMNLFAALRAAESQLGITPQGCASGSPPGHIGTCATGWSADLRAVFHM